MTFKWHILLFSSILILAGCGSIEPPPPSRTPLPTLTPISTPLPYIPTDIPAGFNDENPIQIVIVPADVEVATARLDEFESTLQELLDVTIRVVLAETDIEAAGLICDSESGILSAGWIDGMSAITLQLAGCGIGTIQADTPEGTGRTGVLLRNVEFDNSPLTSMLDAPLCRISATDLFSWTLPVLFYGNEGITVPQILEIREVADNDTIVADLRTGDCATAGMAEADWEAYLQAEADSDEELEEGDTLLANVIVSGTSPEIPYRIMTFSASIFLDVVTEVETAILEMDVLAGRSDPPAEATEEPGANPPDVEESLMTAFFGEGALQALDAESVQELIDFMLASGIDFAELGN